MENVEKVDSPKIFLVDDEPYCLYLYEQVIRNLGYRNTQTFTKSGDCLNRLVEKPDIIFLDYNMDNLNGIDILKKIKRFDPDIAVFFISGQDEISVAVNALKYGAMDYIVKQDISEERMKLCMDKATMMRGIISGRKKFGFLKKIIAGISAPVSLFLIESLISKN